MKAKNIILPLLCLSMTMAAQDDHNQSHLSQVQEEDSTDIFYNHLNLSEVVVTGITGETKLKHSTTPVSLITGKEIRQTASTNVIDAIARQPGMSQITTGSSISKPIIRGLGYNRIVVLNDGVRQEGQQWGDEHGIEIDANTVNSVEILKGPASLMYGSDALAGVLILHGAPMMAEDDIKGSLSTEYQTNNGLVDYSLNIAGNKKGFVWDGRFTDKYAHAYTNKYDGYVPGSQFQERGGRLMLGLNKMWGNSRIITSAFHQTPSIVEGKRDAVTGELIQGEGFTNDGYSITLPFQNINHYKIVWDNSFNLSRGWLKAILAYQQNRRQEFEESADEYELYFKLHTLTYDVRYLMQEFSGLKVASGINGMWQLSQNLGEETLIPAYNLYDIGSYATISKASEFLTLNGGVRYDYRHLDFSSLNFSAVTGSFGAVWNACRHTSIRLNMARGFRAPNMSELGSDGVHEGTIRYELGNAQLKPEYSWQADLGADYSDTHISAQIALFANLVQNYIFAQRIPIEMAEGYRTYQYTQGNARLLGFEAGIDFHPIHSIHFQNTFSYVDARQLNANEDAKYLPMIPAPRWTSELKHELTHQNRTMFNNAFVSLCLEYNLAQNHYCRVDETETRTPSYALLNLSAGSDIMVKKQKMAEIYIIADNLLNKTYQNHLSRLKYCDTNTLTGLQGVYNMGRNVTFKVVVPF